MKRSFVALGSAAALPALTLLSGCAAGPNLTVPDAASQSADQHISSGYVYVSNRTKTNISQLLVYSLYNQSAPPIRTITQGLSNVGGVAVDSGGDVFVANGGARNVLEYAPGGAAVVQTYSQGLVYPVSVTVAGNTLYVADQGAARNGYKQQIFEYTIGSAKPSVLGIGGIGAPLQLNEGIAVNPLGGNGTFFATASSVTAIPPPNACPLGSAYTVAENLQPTLWMIVPLSHNAQVSGIAFDSSGDMYVADPCGNDVAIYKDADYIWTYAGHVSGTFHAPLFLTINGRYLAVPNATGISHGAGLVSVVDLTGHSSTTTIANGLTYPVGAAVTAGP